MEWNYLTLSRSGSSDLAQVFAKQCFSPAPSGASHLASVASTRRPGGAERRRGDITIPLLHAHHNTSMLLTHHN